MKQPLEQLYPDQFFESIEAIQLFLYTNQSPGLLPGNTIGFNEFLANALAIGRSSR